MFATVTEHNPHWDDHKQGRDLMPRPAYLEQIHRALNRREILVITGIRRAGKSSLLKLLTLDLLDKGVRKENILYLNLEDYRFGAEKNVWLLDKLWTIYQEQMRPQDAVYVMLDEIQEVEQFEKWLRTMYELHPEAKFIVTGSSSKLSSGEIATLLTGRQITLEIFPFSFMELLRFHRRDQADRLASETIESLHLSRVFGEIEEELHLYVELGGFPEVVRHRNQSTNIMLLQQYLDDILLKDIGQRYNIRKIQTLKKFTAYLISNMANEINFKRSAALLGVNRSTALDFMSYLKEVYLIQTTTNFSFSLNERLNTTKPRKVFCIDNGFFTAVKQTQTRDLGKRIENLVHQQLRFHWREEVYYWKGKVEIDFVLQNGFPINVTVEDAIPEREVTGLFYYLNHFNMPKGLLVSWNRFETIEDEERQIVVVPLWVFLTKSKNEILTP